MWGLGGGGLGFFSVSESRNLKEADWAQPEKKNSGWMSCLSRQGPGPSLKVLTEKCLLWAGDCPCGLIPFKNPFRATLWECSLGTELVSTTDGTCLTGDRLSCPTTWGYHWRGYSSRLLKEKPQSTLTPCSLQVPAPPYPEASSTCSPFSSHWHCFTLGLPSHMWTEVTGSLSWNGPRRDQVQPARLQDETQKIKDSSKVTSLKVVVLGSKIHSSILLPLVQARAGLGFLLVMTQATPMHFNRTGLVETGHVLTVEWLIYLYNIVMVLGQITCVNLDVGLSPDLLIVTDHWVCFELTNTVLLRASHKYCQSGTAELRNKEEF